MEELQVRNVAIYIRWSTEDQGDGTTLDVQMDACKSYILSQGWSYRDNLVYIDDGISGGTTDRPALTRLRQAVGRGEVDCVVVYKLDRLSRSVLDMVKLVLEEWEGRCYVKSAREPIDTLTPTGKMFFYQLMSFAEWERNVIKERTFSGKLRRAQEGHNPGLILPYGLVQGSDGTVQQDPAKAAAIRRMFELYLGGSGFGVIAATLDAEGFPPPKGATWSKPSISDMLRNPAYMGALVYGREKMVKGKRVPRQPLVVRENIFPAIVSSEVFEAVQNVRADRPGVQRQQGTGRTLGSQSLLTGLLRCRCGAAATGKAIKKANGVTYLYYLCGARQHGSHRCPSGNLRQEDLDNLVVSQLLHLYRSKQAKEAILNQMAGDVSRRYEEATARKAAAEERLKRLDDSERRLKGLFLEGPMSLDEYRQLQAELNSKLHEARDQHEKALAAESDAKTSLQTYRHNTVLLDRINDWEVLTLRERKQLLRHFVQQVVAYRDRTSDEFTCDITWKWLVPDVPAETVQVASVERPVERHREAARKRARVVGRFASNEQ
ncbi:MAG TPA: recombinase family protein [Symbiobacteriaceae bacterium]|nr:recombinase family protein [Symbiobacteriaceae bacterium]